MHHIIVFKHALLLMIPPSGVSFILYKFSLFLETLRIFSQFHMDMSNSDVNSFVLVNTHWKLLNGRILSSICSKNVLALVLF